MFYKKTVHEIDLSNKRVLVHAELDAPLDSDGKKVTSDLRPRSAMPTIKMLLEHNCSVVLVSKLGRPEGKRNPKMSLKPVAECLSGLLGTEITFVDDCIGGKVKEAAGRLQPGQIMMLENVRFYPEEEKNDNDFAKQVVADTGAEIFVSDCFSLAHRDEALITAVCQFLPSVGGLHLVREYETITGVMENPERPLITVIGGAKISDKIKILRRFVEKADYVAVIGAMANTFFAVEGVKIGRSLAEHDSLEIAKDILHIARERMAKEKFTFYLPHDVVVAKGKENKYPTRVVDINQHVWSDITHYPKKPAASSYTIESDEAIFDIGPMSAAHIAGAIQMSKTAIWNGPAGVTETKGLAGAADPFSHGTRIIVEALVGEHSTDKNKPFTVVGGGDTTGYVESLPGLYERFNHVSTGGGASLELMSRNSLPAIDHLWNKD